MNARRVVFASCLIGLSGAVLPLSATSPSTHPATWPTTQPHLAATQPYVWRQANDAAGGDCLGIYFHGQDASIRYVRSFATGGYRWDGAGQRWVGFADPVDDPTRQYLVGLAVDPTDRDVVYYAAARPNGEVYKSTDRGQSFVAAGLAVPRAGNEYVEVPWRQMMDEPPTGERLVVDPNNPAVLYLAARNGLFRTSAASAPGSWGPVTSFPALGDVESQQAANGIDYVHQSAANGGLSCVAIDAGGGAIEVDGVRRSRVLYVGVVGDRRTRRHPDGPDRSFDVRAESGVWRSTDGGQTWGRLVGHPRQVDNAVTRVVVRRDGAVWATVSGRLLQVQRETVGLVDITPPAEPGAATAPAVATAPATEPPNVGPAAPVIDGFVAVAVDSADPRHAVVARYAAPSAGSAYGAANRLYRTTDGGQTWRPLAVDAALPPWGGRFADRTAYLRFEPNAPKDAAGRSRTLWLGDRLGPWVCADVDAAVTHWKLVSRGRGGTKVTEIACPPAVPGVTGGPGTAIAPLLTATGGGGDAADAGGGFRYVGLSAAPDRRLTESPGRDVSARGSSAGDGFAVVTGVAFCERDPTFVAAVGGWRGPYGSFGGGAVSRDNGRTWSAFGGTDLPAGATSIDRPAVPGPRRPSDVPPHAGTIVVGSGRPAGGGDPPIVWTPGGGNQTTRYSHDGGKTWTDGRDGPGHLYLPVLAADPVDGGTFYGLYPRDARDIHRAYGDSRQGYRVLASTDGGANWAAVGTVQVRSGTRDGLNVRLWACPGRRGDLWLAAEPWDNEIQSWTLPPPTPVAITPVTTTPTTTRPTKAATAATPIAAVKEPRNPLFTTPLHRSTDGGRTWFPVGGWLPAYSVAFGPPAPGRTNPSVVVAGELNGKLGIYLSDDITDLPADRTAEATWRSVWDAATTDVPSVVRCLRTIGADRQSYGRVYAGATTVGRGLFYGEPVPSAPPAAPTNVTAEPIAAGGVKIEWTDPIGAAEYDVQRQVVGEADAGPPPTTREAPASQPATAPATAAGEWRTVVTSVWQSRFVDASADPKARYRYRVVASNAFGRSDPSDAPVTTPRP